MGKKFICLACRMDSERAIKLSKRIFEYLVKKGEVVYLETRIAPKIFPHNGVDLSNINSENTKFIVSVGGDGTLLRVAKGITRKESPPILGVNIGSLGFLDETNDRQIFKDLNKVLNGDYIIEQSSRITPYIVKNGEEICAGSALNEVLIVSSKNSKVLQIAVKVNGIFLNRSYLDGVIISTSTGSTAYNLSAGGSIVSPTLQIMQLTPVNSFARPSLRPMVLPIDSEIEITLIRPRLNARIVIDGQKTIKKVLPHTKIRIRKSNSCTKFIRLTDNFYGNYFRRLRRKILGTLRTPLDDTPEE